MRLQLIQSLFAMIAMTLGITLISPTAFAENAMSKLSEFQPMSAMELQKKSPKFRSQYMDKLANFVADYESLVARANDGGFIVPKSESAKYMEIFGGSKAYAANSQNKGIHSRSRAFVDIGSPCMLAAGIGIQGPRFCEATAEQSCAVSDPNKKGLKCPAEVFGYDENGKEFCKAYNPKVGVGRDFSREFCVKERNKIPEAVRIKNDTAAIDARARANGVDGFTQWVNEINTWNNTVGRLCIDNAKKLGLTNPETTAFNTCNPNPDTGGLGGADAGTVIFLNNNLCACTGVLTKYQQVPQPIKSTNDFLKPMACIKDAFNANGEDISDKYLAMIATQIQAVGHLNGDNPVAGNGKGIGAYDFNSLADVRENVMENYTYKRKLFGTTKKANPNRKKLRRPMTCHTGSEGSQSTRAPIGKEKFGQTPRQLFLRRIVENVEAKGWCSSRTYPLSQNPKSLSSADRDFLNQAISGADMPSRRTPGKKAYLKTASRIFGIDASDTLWNGTFVLSSQNPWTRGSLHDRRTTYQAFKESFDKDPRARQGFTGAAKACINETASKSKEAKTDLCIAMAKSCGLNTAICNKKQRCVDVSGYRKAGDGHGTTLSGTKYDLEYFKSNNPPIDVLERSGK